MGFVALSNGRARTREHTYCCDLRWRISHGNVVRFSSGDAIDRLGVEIWGFCAREGLWRRLFWHVCGRYLDNGNGQRTVPE